MRRWCRSYSAFLSVVLPVLGGGGAVRGDGIAFEEVSTAWGLEVRHHNGASGELYMVETMGSGVVVFDYDRDGDADLFFVDSAALPGYTGEPPRSRLLRNDGAGVFIDVTDRAGIAVAAYGMGAVAGDVDADGDPDLYVTSFGPNQLFRNEGDGTFTDATAEAGVGDERWSTSASFADVDRDGDLDLYVANYVDFTLADNKPCDRAGKGLRSYCHPDVYSGQADVFYENRTSGSGQPLSFFDATASSGIAAATGGAAGKGLGVVAGDLDGDGWIDLYVANDMTRNYQFRNLGAGRGAGEGPAFEELALLTGVAVSDEGKEEAGMGIALGDMDGDGRADLLVTHLDLQSNAVYGNTGGFFLDRRFASKLAMASIFKVGFGTAFADFDHDGDLDLAVANGHIIHNVELWGTGTTYKQANQVFENFGDGSFAEVAAGVDVVRASRGLAHGDLDGDGDLDLVITNSDDSVEVYENRSATAAAGWLSVVPRRRTGNRDAIGARVVVEAARREQVREVRTASSYLSQNDLPVHFGLGAARRVDALRVDWPEGGRTRVHNLPVNRRLILLGDQLLGDQLLGEKP